MVQVRCTATVSCHVLFCVWGAAECHASGKQSPPSPKGVTPAAARTMLLLVLRVRSCREGPEHFGPTLLSHSVDRDGMGCQATLARLQTTDSQPEASSVHGIGFTTRTHRCAPVTTQGKVWINDPRAFRCTASDPRPHALTVCVHDTKLPPVRGVGSTIQRLVKKRPTTWDRASP